MTTTAEARWEQYNEEGRSLFARGDLPGAERAFVAAIREAVQLGETSLRLASSLSNLGQLRYRRRDFTRAEELFKKSLEIREQSLGPHHPGAVQTINNLAALYFARGEVAEAERHYRRALTILEQHYGPEHAELGGTLNNLARLCFHRGDHDAAAPLLLRLLAVKQAQHGPDHAEIAAVLTSLAKVRCGQEDFDAAEQLARRALSIRERAEKGSEPALAATLEALADACAGSGKVEEEIDLLERALAVRAQALGDDHSALAALRERIERSRATLSPADGGTEAPSSPNAAHPASPSRDPERLNDATRSTDGTVWIAPPDSDAQAERIPTEELPAVRSAWSGGPRPSLVSNAPPAYREPDAPAPAPQDAGAEENAEPAPEVMEVPPILHSSPADVAAAAAAAPPLVVSHSSDELPTEETTPADMMAAADTENALGTDASAVCETDVSGTEAAADVPAEAAHENASPPTETPPDLGSRLDESPVFAELMPRSDLVPTPADGQPEMPAATNDGTSSAPLDAPRYDPETGTWREPQMPSEPRPIMTSGALPPARPAVPPAILRGEPAPDHASSTPGAPPQFNGSPRAPLAPRPFGVPAPAKLDAPPQPQPAGDPWSAPARPSDALASTNAAPPFPASGPHRVPPASPWDATTAATPQVEGFDPGAGVPGRAEPARQEAHAHASHDANTVHAGAVVHDAPALVGAPTPRHVRRAVRMDPLGYGARSHGRTWAVAAGILLLLGGGGWLYVTRRAASPSQAEARTSAPPPADSQVVRGAAAASTPSVDEERTRTVVPRSAMIPGHGDESVSGSDADPSSPAANADGAPAPDSTSAPALPTIAPPKIDVGRVTAAVDRDRARLDSVTKRVETRVPTFEKKPPPR
ncbi:MAG TPA: tetratricopeptide repeat protein [Gemmatimonadaceae bacterium]|nr:tetratricopeptide repeat protein [Gemmatimonadaceae bacterium]